MVQATTKFLADTAPYGQFKCIRFGNETEFMGKDYQNRKNAIRHDTSVPQHQTHNIKMVQLSKTGAHILARPGVC